MDEKASLNLIGLMSTNNQDFLNGKINIATHVGEEYSDFNYKPSSMLDIINTTLGVSSENGVPVSANFGVLDVGAFVGSVGDNTVGLSTNQVDRASLNFWIHELMNPISVENDYVDLSNLRQEPYLAEQFSTWSSDDSHTISSVVIITPHRKIYEALSVTVNVRVIWLEIKIDEREHKRLHKQFKSAVTILIQ